MTSHRTIRLLTLIALCFIAAIACIGMPEINTIGDVFTFVAIKLMGAFAVAGVLSLADSCRRFGDPWVKVLDRLRRRVCSTLM